MTRALKEAMEESAGRAPPGGEFNIVMANRIMTAVAAGERDLDALKLRGPERSVVSRLIERKKRRSSAGPPQVLQRLGRK